MVVGTLVTLAVPLVPLVSLAMSSTTIAGEREVGTMEYLLAQPATKVEVFFGKYVGLVTSLTLAMFLGYGGAELIVYSTNPEFIASFMFALAYSLLLAGAAVGLGFIVSVSVKTRAAAIGTGLFLWFVLVVIYDSGFLGVITVALDADSLLIPLFLTSVTTIAAFLTLITSPLEPLFGYGICISVGIGWAWFLSSLMLPAVISLKKWDHDSRAIAQASVFERLVGRLGELVLKYPKYVFAVGLLLVFFGLAGLYKITVDVNVASFFKPGTEIRDSMDFMDQEMTGTMDLRIRVEGDIKDPGILRKMDSLQVFVEKNKKIAVTYSIADVVKQMHRTVMDDSLKYESIPQSREKVNNLFTMYSMSGDPEDFSAMIDYDYTVGLITALSTVMTTEEVFSFVVSISNYITTYFNENLNIDVTGMIVVIRDMVILITVSYTHLTLPTNREV